LWTCAPSRECTKNPRLLFLSTSSHLKNTTGRAGLLVLRTNRTALLSRPEMDYKSLYEEQLKKNKELEKEKEEMKCHFNILIELIQDADDEEKLCLLKQLPVLN
jgi:predicted nuclease with TOPRIM domain